MLLYNKLVEERDLILTLIGKNVQVSDYPYDSMVRCYKVHNDIRIEYKYKLICSYDFGYPNRNTIIRLWNKSHQVQIPSDVDIDISLYKEDIDYRFQISTAIPYEYIYKMMMLDIYKDVYNVIDIISAPSVEQRIEVYREILEKYCA